MDKIIIGLGNPGKKYKNTRHNAGFRVVDSLASESDVRNFLSSSHAEAVTADVVIGGQKILLVKPQTFMNKSGQAVQSLTEYFGVGPGKILVIHDDIDLPLGELRMSFQSSAGGHKGVQSVIDTLDTEGFTRLRIGIRPDPASHTDRPGSSRQDWQGREVGGDLEEIDTRDYVLQKFDTEQREVLRDKVLPAAHEAVKIWVNNGHQAAMNAIND